MGEILKQRIKQEHFSSVHQEAILSMLVAADHIQRELDASCDKHGITGAQYNVLRILRGMHPNGHPRCEIIVRMIQTAPDVTRLIDRLVKAGLARRGKSDDDGRLSLTFITDKGLALLSKMEADVTRASDHVATKLSKSDAKQLTALCERIFAE